MRANDDCEQHKNKVHWTVRHPKLAIRRIFHKPYDIKSIEIKNILQSGEASIPAGQYSRLISDPLRPSRRIIDGPQVDLLNLFEKHGKELFESNIFETTKYFENAVTCINSTGKYFPYTKTPKEVILVAQRFIESHVGQGFSREWSDQGHNSPTAIPEVISIANSDCYQMLNGNHRTASAWVKGKQTILARVYRKPVSTPAQEMLKDVLWQNARRELYQPVELPEVLTWPVVRRCSDRFNMMINFLKKENKGNQSYLDVGSSYGWFVKSFHEAGYDSNGVEIDRFANLVGTEIYGIDPTALNTCEIAGYLSNINAKSDIVSCFSVAHHFALGRSSISAEELLKLLDRATARLLFFDTGQNHEDWFSSSLPQWDNEYIKKWILSNSSFTKVFLLGEDNDNTPPYGNNYRRTLFAATRD